MKRFALFALLILITALFARAQTTQLTLNGYISAEYIKSQEGGIYPDGTFRNPQLGLLFSGMLVGRIGCVAEASLRQDAEVELNQALLKIYASNAITINLGLYLVPFGKYNQNSRAYQTLLIERPLSVQNLYPANWRDIGIQIDGLLFGLNYAFYLGNGLSEGERLEMGQQFEDNNANKAFGGRLAWIIDGQFEVGYSHYRGKYDKDNSRHLILHGVDASWLGQSFQILGEYTWTDIRNPAGYANGDGKGYFILLAFDFLDLWPIVSYQKLDYEDPFHGNGFVDLDNQGEGINENIERWSLGLAYKISQMAFIKLEYQYNKEEEQGKKDNVLLVQVALSF